MYINSIVKSRDYLAYFFGNIIGLVSTSVFIADKSTKFKQSVAPILAYLQLAVLSVYGAEYRSTMIAETITL